MPWLPQDLLLYTLSVYGFAWLATKSKIMRPVREAFGAVSFVRDVLSCTVCTATWLGFVAMAVLPATHLFSTEFRVSGVADFLVLTGWTLGSSWTMARSLGDASTESSGKTS